MSGPPSALVDPFGRTVRDLRISVTDRCNFRCSYCMPAEGMNWLDRADLLTFEEIERVARLCVTRFGFGAIRLTGGEPTVRAGLCDLVARLAAVLGDAGAGGDLSLTTNGATLGLVADDLRRAGLARVNISCDTLRPERFAALARRDVLPQVLDGIDAALRAGFHPVKVNVVLLRGVNDDEIVELARFGRTKGVTMRFIEFMPLDAQGAWQADAVVPSDEVVATINAVFPLEAANRHDAPEPADRYRYLDGHGEVGVVASVTRPFCGSCDRVRITAEGMFRNCLFSLGETDLRAIMRGGGTDDDLADAIEADVGTKWSGHSIGRISFVKPPRSMSQIGG